MLEWIAAAVLSQAPKIEVDYRSQSGLEIAVEGVPVVRGSFFQYYAPGWARGYYSSNWNPQTVRRSAGVVEVEFRGANGTVEGSQKYTVEGNRVLADYTFTWKGEQTAMIENTLGLLWAPVIQDSRLFAAGSWQPSLANAAPVGTSFEDRTLTPFTGSFRFEAPFGTIELHGERDDAVLVDGRNYDQMWAERREVFWLGQSGLAIEPGETLSYRYVWTFDPRPLQPEPTRAMQTTTKTLDEAYGSFEAALPPIPAPQSYTPKEGVFVLDLIEPEEGREPHPLAEYVLPRLRQRFEIPDGLSVWPGGTVGMDSAMPAGRCRIEVTPRALNVDVGMGAEHFVGAKIADLAQVRNGRLVLPCGVWEYEPQIERRAVHMFVGPQALEFQSRMMDRLLVPLGYNAVVLQCERATWAAIPGTATGDTMQLEDLKALTQRYRSKAIDVIPLIQSWGHSGWLFANGQNRDLVFNPEEPFAIDPRKAEARAKISEIWSEVNRELTPAIAHFGLDEVNLRGGPDNEELLTQMWVDYLPRLGELARELGTEMMLWGDKALAPGEAPDATHAPNKAHAERRRAAIPKGAHVADWHYRDDPNPAIYTSLKLWKDNGQVPWAATWYRPGNIRGMALAAAAVGANYMQTTWASYQSTEGNMLTASDQLASYVLGGDYSWSARQELPEELPYDSTEVIRRWMFEPANPIRTESGVALELGGDSRHKVIGNVRFLLSDPLEFFSPLRGGAGPLELRLNTEGEVREVSLALSVQAHGEENQTVAELVLEFADGTAQTVPLRYGVHLRAAEDPLEPLKAARVDGLCAARTIVGTGLASVRIRVTEPAIGLALHGVTLRT